jgi:predicted ester cyclase
MALRARDATALGRMYSGTCVVESPTAGGSVTGSNAIADVYAAWFKGFPDLVTTFDEPLIDGDRVVQFVVSEGTDTGGFLGVPPTGKPFRIPIVFLSTVKDHQIVHEQRVYDFTGMLVQIGVLKAKPAV